LWFFSVSIPACQTGTAFSKLTDLMMLTVILLACFRKGQSCPVFTVWLPEKFPAKRCAYSVR
jgi:hypothetical protein